MADDMKAGGFSHVPIVDEGDVVVGVFNEAAVFDYLWSESEKIIGRSMSVEEVLPHCRLDANHTETFRFVRPSRASGRPRHRSATRTSLARTCER